ncbi:MAG: ribosome silencing factor [Candidatus Bipolaricaulota bacterium]|nr:MAG: ribosome silencing factor [Candidatus Bipolaricaulota bacterium]
MDELDLVARVLTLLDERKAQDPIVVDLREVSIPTGFFVIASADNPVHAKALVNALREGLPRKPDHGEGLTERRWIVLDYGDVVVHLFQREARDFYDIESLWSDHLVPVDQIASV